MSRPELTHPACWGPVSDLPVGNYPYMTCHWKDVERGEVVPKYAGQVFYFADLYEMRVFKGYPEPEPKGKWGVRFIIILFLILFTIDIALAWYLLDRKEWW